MNRPIRPKERPALNAADKARAAREALRTLREELMEAAAETWLTWEWDKFAREWCARHADNSYVAAYRPGVDRVCAWVVIFPTALQRMRFDSPEDAKRACEDHARQRGQFAPKETT